MKKWQVRVETDTQKTQPHVQNQIKGYDFR